jgi:hypothetical protein
MTALHLITQEYRAVALQLADLDLDPQTVADTLEGMSGDLEVKAQNVALFVRSLEADAAAVKQWSKDAADRAKAIENRAESLRDYLARCLDAADIQKIEGPGIRIGWRKSSAVVIDNAEQIPDEFMRTPEPPPPAPDKRAIGDAIKAGATVPGARIEDRRGLVIK